MADDDPWIFRKRVDEVTVFFTATKGHRYIDDLTQDEIKISDDRKPPVRISAFGHQTDLPLRLALLVDTSDSIDKRFSFEKDAASRFLRSVLRPGIDQAFVVGFSQLYSLAQDYTDNADQLMRGVSGLSLGGSTAIYDAIQRSVDKLADEQEGEPTARILVLLSDGDDNSSQIILNDVIRTAQLCEITIYSVSTNNSEFPQRGDNVLKQLAAETGGKAFFPKNAKDTVKAFNAVEQEMRSRYVVSYKPRDLVPDGRFRRIQIIAKRMNQKLHVQSRRGYYAPLERQLP
jgi:VWFA-related protein